MSVDLVATGEEDRPGDQEGEQRDHLHQGGPELELSEHRHRYEVDAEHHRQRGQGDHPLGDGVEGAPEPEVGGDRGRVDDRRHRPVQEVHPPGHVSGLLPEELPRIGDEGARRRPVQDQFAHRPQNQEHEDSAEPVDQEQPGAGAGQPAARPEEQSGPDRAADGDHLQLPRFEALVVPGVLPGKGRGLGGAGHGGHRSAPPLL